MKTLMTWLPLEDRTTPATASGTFADITTLSGAGTSSTVLVVRYEADPGEAIDTATLGADDISVSGPSYTPTVALQGFSDPNGDQSLIFASYSIGANPLGTANWDIADNGAYDVTLNPAAVKTTTAVNVPGGPLGTFHVAIGKTYVIMNSADSGSGSLRDILAAAAIDTPDALDIITFDPSHFSTKKTIALQSELVIDSSVMIVAPTVKIALDAAVADTRAVLVSNSDPASIDVRLSNLVIINSGGAVSGGGISVGEADALTLTDCDVSNNTGGAGGGIFVGQDASLALTRTTISGNSAIGSGGGIYFFNNGSLSVDASSITGNRADGNNGGGGVYFFGAAPTNGLRIANSTISSNSAPKGGGLVMWSGTPETELQVFNSTIAANTALEFGGGIARPGGNGTVVLISSIVSGNSAAEDADINLDDNLVAATNSAIGSGVGEAWATAYQAAVTKNLPFGSDLKLQALAVNGTGFTKSHALGIGSAAREMGVNPLNLTVDQTGAPRVNGVIDIGSFERVPGQPVATAGTLADVTANTAGNNPYTFTVTYADDTAINKATVGDAAEVQVSRTGGGFSTPATFVSVTPNASASTLVATYKFTPPGGTWDGTDNGTYTVELLASAVANTSGTAIAAGSLGSFRVGVSQTFTVTNALDSGAGSLRQAILNANAADGVADSVVFDPTFFASSRTINLASELLITDALTITGPGATLLTLQGGGSTRLLHINSADRVAISLSGITLTGGSAATDGGAILLDNELLTLTNCVITANTATNNGGAVSMTDIGSLTIIGSTVTNNKALTDDGGAINFDGAGRLVLQETTLSGNSAAQEGGVAYFFTGGSLRVERSTLSGNTAGGALGGGAVYFFGSVDDNGVHILNSTISGNSTAGAGALHFRSLVTDASKRVDIQNSTLTLNTGGVVISSGAGTATIESSIVAGNGTDTSGAVTASYSAIGTAGPGFVSGGNNLAAGFNLNLGPLTKNGGPTLTHQPGAGSAAINAGSNPEALSIDQRGFLRSNNTIDIGAVEVQPAGTPVVVGFSVNNGSIQRSRLTTITVDFASAITPAAAGAMTLTRTIGGTTIVQTGAVGPNGLISVVQGTSTSLVLTFSNANGASTSTGVEFGSLSNGRWQLSIPAANYSSPLNDPSLRRLFGDVNGDGTVDGGTDFAAFRLGNVSVSVAAFDWNGDGTIDGGTDFAVFGTNFGRSV